MSDIAILILTVLVGALSMIVGVLLGAALPSTIIVVRLPRTSAPLAVDNDNTQRAHYLQLPLDSDSDNTVNLKGSNVS